MKKYILSRITFSRYMFSHDPTDIVHGVAITKVEKSNTCFFLFSFFFFLIFVRFCFCFCRDLISDPS